MCTHTSTMILVYRIIPTTTQPSQSSPQPPSPPWIRRTQQFRIFWLTTNSIPATPTRRPPPPPQPPPPHHQQPRMDYNPVLVGHSLEHSLRVLGLGLGASEMEVEVQYHALARIYHPDKHDPTITGMTHEAAADFFKIINNANSYLQEIMWPPRSSHQNASNTHPLEYETSFFLYKRTPLLYVQQPLPPR